VLDYPVFGSFWFLNNLPTDIALGLHNIAITQRLARLSNPNDVEKWYTPEWKRASFFTSSLQQRFPNVDKVRFEIGDPSMYNRGRVPDWFFKSLSHQIVLMLEEKWVNMMALYTLDPARVNERELYSQFGPPDHIDFDWERLEETGGLVADRDFDVVVETPNDQDDNIWTLLRAKRVYKITRWGDTQIGDQFYPFMWKPS
jgi:hypothetical protein